MPQGRWQRHAAIADFTKALKLNPKDTQGRVSCLIGRARANFDKEKAEPAMADLNAAIKLGIKQPDAYVLRGILHKINHNYARSLADSIFRGDPSGRHSKSPVSARQFMWTRVTARLNTGRAVHPNRPGRLRSIAPTWQLTRFLSAISARQAVAPTKAVNPRFFEKISFF